MRVNSVYTCATKPGTTMVFTLVPVIRRPWMTSGVAKRSVTRRPRGTAMQRGTNMNCVAIDPHGDAAVRSDRRSEILLGELARQMQCLGIDPLHVAGRVYAPGQSREHDHAEDRGNEHADAERPQQFGAENSPLVHFGGMIGHG